MVYDRPDMESWWNKLQGQGVLGSYPRGADVGVEHIEEEWLEAGEVELERRKSKQKKDAEAGDGPKAAVVAATVVEPGWDTPKGTANVGNRCYINTILQRFMAAAPIAMSMWVRNCNGEALTQRIKDVMHVLEVDGVAQRNTLMEVRYSVVTEAIKDGLYGGGRDPDTWLCATEVLQLMSGRGRLTEVVVGEKLQCTHCGCTHVTAQTPAMLVQLGLPEVGAQSIDSMVHRWGDDEVLKDYRCPREECGLVRERREWRVLKQNLFVSTPNVMVFGRQQL